MGVGPVTLGHGMDGGSGPRKVAGRLGSVRVGRAGGRVAGVVGVERSRVPCQGMRCLVYGKPGVGWVHLHRRWWRPGRVFEVWFHPVEGSSMLLVDESDWDAVLGAGDAEALVLVAGRSRVRAPAPGRDFYVD